MYIYQTEPRCRHLPILLRLVLNPLPYAQIQAAQANVGTPAVRSSIPFHPRCLLVNIVLDVLALHHEASTLVCPHAGDVIGEAADTHDDCLGMRKGLVRGTRRGKGM
jgi:hypothetical protein